MAETTLLRQSAIVRNASVGTSPPSPPRGPVKTGELPLVQVKMGPGGPQVLTPQQKPVEILAPRDEDAAVRTGGLPKICVKMTSRGPQPDNGQDSTVMILPPKDQGHTVVTGSLPRAQVKTPQAGPQVHNLPHVQSARPQVQGPAPALSQPRGVAASLAIGSTVRIAAPQTPLPPVPEFTADQLMLCRHVVGKYLADLRALETAVPSETSVEAVDAGSKDGSCSDNMSNAVLAEATIDMIDQALVAVAVRAEAAVANSVSVLSEDQETPVAVATLPTAPTASIIPAAPSASYVAGRVGGRPNGYTGGRVQRNAAMAPRRVPRAGALPPVIVKMENGRSVVQNKEEVAAVRAAVAAQTAFVPEVPSVTVDGNAQD